MSVSRSIILVVNIILSETVLHILKARVFEFHIKVECVLKRVPSGFLEWEIKVESLWFQACGRMVIALLPRLGAFNDNDFGAAALGSPHTCLTVFCRETSPCMHVWRLQGSFSSRRSVRRSPLAACRPMQLRVGEQYKVGRGGKLKSTQTIDHEACGRR